MRSVKVSIFLVLVLLAAFSVFAAQINSTSYKQSVIVSAGGENVSSPSYKMNVAISIISKIINSTSYINRLGFFHTVRLANDQPCTTASQCEGGYCCSNLCKSSACPSDEAAPGGGGGGTSAGAGGGGGGGGGPLPTPIEEPKVKDFSISPSSIKEQMILGAAKTKTITIKNTGNAALNFKLEISALSGFIFLSDTSFSLDAGQEKAVEATIIGKKLGSYIGSIDVEGEGIKKSVSVVIDVESEEVLFDVKMDIPSGYKEVEAGNDLKTQITLLNVGPAKKVDVTATYIIKDRHGNVVHESSETFAVEKQTSFVKPFKIPKNLQPGEYLAIIELRYADSFAVSSELFKVVPKEAVGEKALKPNIMLVGWIVFAGLVFLFAYLMLPKVNIFKKLSRKKGRKRKR